MVDMIFFLSGEDPSYQMKMLQIPHSKLSMTLPIQSKRQYKSLIQKNRKQPISCTAGTTEGDTLQKELLKEYLKTKKLIQISNQMQTASTSLCQERKRKRHSKHTNKRQKKSRTLSSVSAKKIPSKKSNKHQTSSSSYSSSSNSSETSSSNS